MRRWSSVAASFLEGGRHVRRDSFAIRRGSGAREQDRGRREVA